MLGRALLGLFLCSLLAYFAAIFYSGHVSAAQFTNRTLYINSPTPNDTTFYQISFDLPASTMIGSLKFRFCDSPLAEVPCVSPAGFDASSATLTDQQGETGFSILTQNTNTIVLTRTPAVSSATTIKYRFNGMINPSQSNNSFYVRIDDYATNDASGAFTDFGSAAARLNDAITVSTEVPPILVFCVAERINDDECLDANGQSTDVGELSASTTRTAQSQMLARTNAQYGYTITATGTSMSSGTNTIPSPSTPTESLKGVGQFGINLAANTSPAVGANPVGPGTNAVVAPNYATPNRFLYNNGDTLASVSGVSMPRKFTVSYVINVPQNQPPGIYSTTLTYICLAGF